MNGLLATIRRYIVLLGLAAFPLPAWAQVSFPALEDSVAGHGGTTYLDLIRLMTDELTREGDSYRAGELVPLRHISGDAGYEEAPADFEVRTIAALPVKSREKPRLLLLLDLGQAVEGAEGFAVLALFDLSGPPRLLDAANVAYDRDTGFFGPGRMETGGDDLILIASRHSNSNQTYRTVAMIETRGERLQLVDTIFTFNDNGCGFARTQRPRFSMAGRSERAILVEIIEETKRVGAPCKGQPMPALGRRTISVKYRWNAASQRYLKNSDALNRLAKETSKRF